MEGGTISWQHPEQWQLAQLLKAHRSLLELEPGTKEDRHTQAAGLQTLTREARIQKLDKGL